MRYCYFIKEVKDYYEHLELVLTCTALPSTSREGLLGLNRPVQTQ